MKRFGIFYIYLLVGMFLIVVFIGTSHADLNDALVAEYLFNGDAQDSSG